MDVASGDTDQWGREARQEALFILDHGLDHQVLTMAQTRAIRHFRPCAFRETGPGAAGLESCPRTLAWNSSLCPSIARVSCAVCEAMVGDIVLSKRMRGRCRPRSVETI